MSDSVFQPEVVEADGFLFAGDLHLSSRAPSKRRDDYMEAGLRKLKRIVDIANERRLLLVLTGDVFHHSLERSETLKTRLKRILAGCWTTVLTNVGNHDKREDRLGDADSLALVTETGRPLRAFPRSGEGVILAAAGMRIGLGFTPHGQDIPRDVTPFFPGVDATFWVTHHDIAFEGTYPGAVEPFEIAGCGLVVNGHMHLEKETVQIGSTLWHNPGSIMRTAIDAVNHEPCCWAFTPGEGLTRVPIAFERDVFDLVGRLIDEASPGEVVEAAGSSVFVDLLEATRGEAVLATDDGAMLLEAIVAKLQAAKSGPVTRSMVLDLHRRCVERRRETAPV